MKPIHREMLLHTAALMHQAADLLNEVVLSANEEKDVGTEEDVLAPESFELSTVTRRILKAADCGSLSIAFLRGLFNEFPLQNVARKLGPDPDWADYCERQRETNMKRSMMAENIEAMRQRGISPSSYVGAKMADMLDRQTADVSRYRPHPSEYD